MNPLIDDLDFSEADPPLPWGMESRAGARGKLGLAALQNQLNQRTAMARVSGQAQDRRAAMDGGVRQASSGPGLMDVLRLGPQFLQSTASGLASSAISGLSLPGDAWTGKVPVPGVNVPADAPEAPEQRNSLVRRALDLTGTIGSATLAAPRGALGAGAVRPVKATEAATTAAHPFYSTLERVVSRGPASASPQQWLSTIKNAGVKQEELEWSGLGDRLAGQGGPMSKDELLQAVKDGTPKVQEVTKTGGRVDEYGDIVDLPEDESAKFSQYQLPGGDNYREMLFTLPSKAKPTSARLQELYDIASRRTPTEAESEEMVNLERASAPLEGHHTTTGDTFRSSHWDEPNVLAHVRMNDRTIPDASGTPQKTLFLEELQSDWHQAGRKQGYASKDQMSKLGPHDQMSGVPDAPFKKTWPDLVLKRMVREAAEKGYDQIAWTDGATQADRYDLSKQVNELRAFKNPSDGTYSLSGSDKNGQGFDLGKRIPEKELDQHIGKDLASKVVKDGGGSYSGLGLKVGGEGMKGFYDNMLPKIAEKHFGKYGAKVGQSQVVQPKYSLRQHDGYWEVVEPNGAVVSTQFEKDMAEDDLADYNRTQREGGGTVHVLPITPELRRAALSEGFPLFSSGIPSADSSGQPQYKLSPMPDGFNPFTASANRAMMPLKAEPSAGDQSMQNYKLSPVTGNPFER